MPMSSVKFAANVGPPNVTVIDSYVNVLVPSVVHVPFVLAVADAVTVVPKLLAVFAPSVSNRGDDVGSY